MTNLPIGLRITNLDAKVAHSVPGSREVRLAKLSLEYAKSDDAGQVFVLRDSTASADPTTTHIITFGYRFTGGASVPRPSIAVVLAAPTPGAWNGFGEDMIYANTPQAITGIENIRIGIYLSARARPDPDMTVRESVGYGMLVPFDL